MSVAELLNHASEESLVEMLAKCCASRRWVHAMTEGRPYADDRAVVRKATESWRNLAPPDWLEAFAAHPKIGDLESLRAKFASSKDWASREQAGVGSASEDTLRRLAKLNDEYAARFGYIYIVCATGKDASALLSILETRLLNDADIEFRIAADEQLAITLLRLEKLDK